MRDTPLRYRPSDESALARDRRDFRVLMQGLAMICQTTMASAMQDRLKPEEHSEARTMGLLLAAVRQYAARAMINGSELERDAFIALARECLDAVEAQMRDVRPRDATGATTQ